MKQFVAAGSGSAHQVGHVNPRVVHVFAVLVNEDALLVATIAKVPNISQFIQSSSLPESIRNLLTDKNYS